LPDIGSRVLDEVDNDGNAHQYLDQHDGDDQGLPDGRRRARRVVGCIPKVSD
jgi:hypothetical protein